MKEKEQLAEYVALANAETDISFVGRLGTYRYLDMDVTIREALDTARLFMSLEDANRAMPSFLNPPL